MSLFNLIIPNKGKERSPHPWERVIKDKFANKIKYAHNSVNNPKYPKIKHQLPNIDRVKFTVIGDRLSKEFIYCVHLVRILHKYRWKSFSSPVIRGVTTVEWPNVLNNLKIQYGSLAYCLNGSVAVILDEALIGGEKELEEIIETKYSVHLELNYYKEAVAQFASFVKSRPCAYMHISINDDHVGTLILMLYSDIVPNTCENFLRLCQSKRGGYGGTPVHRIVKDGWIQCGGFGMKSSDLECENFIVPHDQRGVLGMANDGRHVDCSTQFFVLLQPAPWMAQKYVAFGQLIDGEETLKKIECVPTFYESPLSNIIIFQAGVLNLECHDIRINKNANEYISGHIEDLVSLGDALYEELMQKVFSNIEQKAAEEETGQNIHATQRFLRKREDMEEQMQKSQAGSQKSSAPISERDEGNNEYDVEVYEYEAEEYSYKHVSLAEVESLAVKLRKPFYIPLTDVPYPGEIDSTYDLKKFLKGNYCLESDLQTRPEKKAVSVNISYLSEMLKLEDETDSVSMESFGSDEEREIRRYIKLHVDRTSFAGNVIRNIARAKFNIYDNVTKSQLLSDEELRRLKLGATDYQSQACQDKKVSLSLPPTKVTRHKIKRRQTGFVKPNDLEQMILKQKSISIVISEDESQTFNRKVRIDPSVVTHGETRPARRATGFVHAAMSESDSELRRQSVLTRLYDNVATDEDQGPTLKEYKPMAELRSKNILLTYSSYTRIKSEENTREKYRQSFSTENHSFEPILNMQHNKKIARKMSSDYVKTIHAMQNKPENSIRSVEYAKTRPSISVKEYQQKNLKHQENLRSSSKLKGSLKKHSVHGIRLPGDTPLYSMIDVEERN